MALSSNDKLGPYEILGLIGAGGMGEVYLARDPRLGRNVAIKVSAERFSERFEREARAVAALNHPNICTLHDVGPDYLVMEFVEELRRTVRCLWAKPCVSRGRLRTHLKPHTKRVSSIATSSRATSRSNPTVQSRSWISAWPR